MFSYQQFTKRGVNLEEVYQQLEERIDDEVEKRGFPKEMLELTFRKVGSQNIPGSRDENRRSSISPKTGRVRSALSAFKTKSMEILPNLLRKHDVKKSPTKLKRELDSQFNLSYGNDISYFSLLL